MNTLNTKPEWLNQNAVFSVVLVLNKHIDNSERKKCLRVCNLSIEEPRLVMVEVFSLYPALQSLNNIINFSGSQSMFLD